MTETPAGPPDRDATAPADPGPEPMPQEGPPEESSRDLGAEPIPEPDRRGSDGPGTGWIPSSPD